MSIRDLPQEPTVAETSYKRLRPIRRRPMPRFKRRTQDYPASNRSDCGPGPVGQAASLSRQLLELRGDWNAAFGEGGGVIRSGRFKSSSIDVQQAVRLQTLSGPK